MRIHLHSHYLSIIECSIDVTIPTLSDKSLQYPGLGIPGWAVCPVHYNDWVCWSLPTATTPQHILIVLAYDDEQGDYNQEEEEESYHPHHYGDGYMSTTRSGIYERDRERKGEERRRGERRCCLVFSLTQERINSTLHCIY